MSRAARALVVAVGLGAFGFGEPGALSVLAVAAALGLAVAGLGAERPRRWGLRAAYALLLAYLVAWAWFRVDAWRLARAGPATAERFEADARDAVAEALGRRLERDRALAERVAGRLSNEASRRGAAMLQDPDLFVALGEAAPPFLPSGVGLQVYDRAGSLRAWWGDPRGERLAPDSVSALVAGTLVRRPSGYTLAYEALPWRVGPDTLLLAVKDVWAVETPLRREVVESNLLVPGLEEVRDLTFEVVPAGSAAPVGGTGATIADPAGRTVASVVAQRFLLERYLAERRSRADRVLAFLFLWPLLWSVATAWRATRRPFRERTSVRASRGSRRLAAFLGQTAIVGAVWVVLVDLRYLPRLLPAGWFSPLAYASTRYGPAGRSPGDFLTTAGLAAFLCLASFAFLPRRGRAHEWWRPTAVTALAFGAAWLAVRVASPALEAAMENMSPSAFFSPTLLFSPPLLMVLLAFALLTGVVVLAIAAAFRWAPLPAGPGAVLVALGLTAASVGAVAWRLPMAALAGERGALEPLLALALVGAGWLAQAAARPGPGRPLSPAVRLGMVAVGIAALVTLPMSAYARVQAAHELLVERAERIGQASTQWLQYTLGRTLDFLVTDPAIERALADGSRDAALLLWSRSPLQELDFASGLYLIDSDGSVVSQFALTGEDMASRARRQAATVDQPRIVVEGDAEERGVWWAIAPVRDSTGQRMGSAVAMATEALELRGASPGAAFVLSDLLAGPGPGPDLPGYTTLGPGEAAPPRTLLTSVGPAQVQLAMPLDPLLPGVRAYAIFVFVGALAGLGLGLVERLGDPRARARWWRGLRQQNPLRSFRVQLLLAFIAVAVLPLTLYAVLGYRATRNELEDATRSAASDALSAADRMLAGDPALTAGTSRALSERLRTISNVLQQDLILYFRGRTVASSRPEIFSSRLFADRMEGEVYAELFAVRSPVVFDETTLGDRSFLVAYRSLGSSAPAGYVLATPLLIREDRVRVDLQRLGEGVFLLSVFSIGFLLIVGWGLARYMARPLSALERGTRQIAGGDLSTRLPVPERRDEFGRLQRSFNAMAARLDESQRALEREKSRVQAILASVGAGVVALDADGRVRVVNDRAARLLDMPAEALLGRSVRELAGRDDLARRFWTEVERELTRERRVDRDLILRRDGEERHYHLVCTALLDGEGEERGMVVAFEDITANVQSQRVLAWGEMARQVAHEIKNPLTPMKLSLQHLERTVEDRAPDFETVFHENLELVLSEIDRLERIAGNFARFAVPNPAARGPFDALEVTRETVDLYAPGDAAVRYEIQVVGEPVALMGDPDGFRRVLVNLLQNGREAVLAQGGGTVEVRLDWEREPGWARVSVLDDGVGLPAEGLERLFEPSFSTKTRGTGLGLAITRRIVEAWGGSIDYERRPAGGTAIHVRLETAQN